MSSEHPTHVDDAIKRLTQLVKEYVHDDRARHDIINMISVINVAIYELRQDLQEAQDALKDKA